MTTTRKVKFGEQTQGQIPSDQLADGTDTAGNVPVANGDGTQTWGAGGSGAPTTADYLVGTAQGGLSAEIVVGATPGGELGNTWASPTVDATHSGSTHSAATDTHIADATDAHDASAISVLDTGANFSGTEVEAVLAEIWAGITAGGIPATIFDVAGDLIVASAADTAVRLPLGTALHHLRVNAAGTGLEYAAESGGAGAWTTHTPSWTSSGTAPAIGNGTLTARYKARDANTYDYYLTFVAGSTTTFGTGTYSFSLPITGVAGRTQVLHGRVRDTGTANYIVAGIIAGGAAIITPININAGGNVSNTIPHTWANTDELQLSGTIEV